MTCHYKLLHVFDLTNMDQDNYMVWKEKEE
jgi:hypothetical protein